MYYKLCELGILSPFHNLPIYLPISYRLIYAKPRLQKDGGQILVTKDPTQLMTKL